MAFLHTGHVLLEPVGRKDWKRLSATLQKWTTQLELESIEKAYRETPVVPTRQYKGLIRMLTAFAVTLSARAEELLLQPRKAEPAVVGRARSFMDSHYNERLLVGQIARGVNVGARYLSRKFKQATGMSLIQYLGRVRVEKAKRLLGDLTLRIDTIALDVGFQSLSQFNRTFRQVTRHAPNELRPK